MSAILDAGDLLSLLTNSKIASLDSLTNLLTGGGAAGEPETIFAHKDSRAQGAATANPAAGAMLSLWTNDGTPLPGAGAPGAFAVPTNATSGGLMQANPGGGRTKLITSAGLFSAIPGLLIIYDRLAHCSGLSGTVTTTQNVNGGVSGDVTRYTDGVGNQLWAEVYTAVGASASGITAVYKDGSGASQTTPTVPIGGGGTSERGRILPLSLVSGGSTVIGCTSVSLSVTTGTAGDFGITIAHPLVYIPISGPSGGVVVDFLVHHLPQIQTNACLALAWIPTTAAAGTVDYFLTSVEA